MHQTCLQLTPLKPMQSCYHSTAHCCEPTCSNLLCKASAGLMGAHATHYLDVPMALSIFKHHFCFTDSEAKTSERSYAPPQKRCRSGTYTLLSPAQLHKMPSLENKVTSSTNSASSKTTATTPLFRPLHGSSDYCTSPFLLQAPSPKLRSLPWHCSIEPSVHLEGTTVLTQISILKTGI